MSILKIPNQKYTSANTSIKQVPLPFKRIANIGLFDIGHRNLDVGGGKFNTTTEYLKDFNIINYVYDPFNRTAEHNNYVLSLGEIIPYDSATVFNVLNVIMEKEVQLELLKSSLKLIKKNGYLYIYSNYKVKGKEAGKSGIDSYQHHKYLNEYLPLVKEVFPDAYVNNKIRCIIVENK